MHNDRHGVARIAIATVTLLAALFMYPADARACSCRDFGTTPERILEADAVFRATIVAVDMPPTVPVEFERMLRKYELLKLPGPGVIVRLQVHEAWKGVHTPEVVLDVGGGECCDCSLGFGFGRPGAEILVYAPESGGALHVSTCNRPIPIGGAGRYLEALGPGQTSFEQVSPEPELERPSTLGVPIWAPIAGAIVLVVGFVVLWPRSRGTPPRESSE